MTRPVLTVRTDNPKLLCLLSEKTAITTRTNSSSAWQTEWDTGVLSYASSALSKTDAALAAESDLDKKFFALGLAGWIDNVTTYHSKMLSAGLYFLNNTSLLKGYTGRRDQLIAMGYGYDFLKTGVITFSDADRKTWGEKVIGICDAVQTQSDKIDGHTGGNMGADLIAALPLRGESGSGFNHEAAAASVCNKALDFWFGELAGDLARMDADRFAASDGASIKGVWYNGISNWHALSVLYVLKKACTAITVAGDPYDPIADESWVAKVGEWWTRCYRRGDDDYFADGDTGRTYVNPFFTPHIRNLMAILIQHGGAWRGGVRRIRDKAHAKAGTSPHSISKQDYAIEVAVWDKGDVACAPKTLAQLGVPKYRLFQPNGDFVYTSDKNGDDEVIIRIKCKEFDFAGHQHLDNGSMQCDVSGDQVLLHAGKFDTGDVAADYGGTHHRNFYQQSISHSGVPLIHDPDFDDFTKGLAHKSRNEEGRLTDYPSGLGGQLWHRYDQGGGNYSYDPPDINTMRLQGGKMAWRFSGIDADGTKRLSIVDAVEDQYLFLHADYTYSYLREAIDVGTVRARVSTVETRWLIIENVGIDPIVFRYDRIVSRLASFVKRQQWHFYRDVNVARLHVGTPQETISVEAVGFRGTGKIFIDTYTGGSEKLSQTIFGGNPPLDLNTFGNQQFAHGFAPNFAPADGPNEREKPDLGRRWLAVSPFVQQVETHFLTVLQPMRVGSSRRDFDWINEPSWYGIKLAADREFRVHKTTLQVQTTADNIPPGVPGPLSASSGPSSGQVTVSWPPNNDDAVSYQVYSRLKV